MRVFPGLVAVGAMLLALVGAASAQSPAATAVTPPKPDAAAASVTKPAGAPSSPAAAATHALTAEDAGAWFDGLVPAAIAKGDVAGAVVVVVKDGQPILERGYGFADVKAQKPVDPARTLFRPGSVSKTLTWTAVMQQVQAGKIDLDADINTYLDFKIAPYKGQPMTMRQLMTHSEGFSDAAKDLIGNGSKSVITTEQLLKRGAPERIYPPGQVPAYSNYGASLAGYIVQRVSGEPFEQYIERHIFTPLGMAHSTFVEPLPANLKPDMAKGYKVASGPAQPFEYVQLAPAGALSATGDDMARFMIAQLNDGEYQGQRILDAKTAQLMHSPQFTPVPGLPSMDLGFYQEPGNGHRLIGHAGDTNFFHSDLHLYLDDHVGLFLSFNSAGAQGAAHTIRAAILKGFTDRYFPAPPPQEPTWSTAKADGAKLAGYYVMSRRSDTGWLRITAFLLGEAKVVADKDGVVTISAFRGPNSKPKQWREVGPFQYREVGGDARMAVLVRDGKVVMIASDDLPPVMALQPVSAAMSNAWNTPAFYLTGVLLALGAATWPLAAFIRWRYGHTFGLTGRAALLYRLTRLVCVIDLAFAGLWLWFIGMAESDLSGASASTDWIVRLIQLVGLVGVVGIAATVANVAVVWRSDRGWFAKLSSVGLALASVGFAWIAFSQHLITAGSAY
ncbi:serine hydrolase domain-containing protein [Phenylobacterium sp.]|jgi:CubicO group peptidase (beta-lactamase class C family)|uniref:serine hydrolase domain-containing protein n=1 Tax=Phenylobacterium sp. TaxID=1871053 RepID=UPI002F3EC5F4